MLEHTLDDPHATEEMREMIHTTLNELQRKRLEVVGGDVAEIDNLLDPRAA